MASITWFFVKLVPGGNTIHILTPNSFVHAIMYIHYLLAVYSNSYRSKPFFKRHVTHIQFVSMVTLSLLYRVFVKWISALSSNLVFIPYSSLEFWLTPIVVTQCGQVCSYCLKTCSWFSCFMIFTVTATRKKLIWRKNNRKTHTIELFYLDIIAYSSYIFVYLV